MTNTQTIRTNAELNEILMECPKNVSYATYLADIAKKLRAYAIAGHTCWIVENQYIGPNQPGAPGAISMVDSHYYTIVDSIPLTNLGRQELEDGWLGNTGDWYQRAHGGFQTQRAAECYIEKFLNARKVTDDDDNEIWTVAEFDEYWHFDDWIIEGDKPDLSGKPDDYLKSEANRYIHDINADGFGFYEDLDEIVEILKKLRDDVD